MPRPKCHNDVALALVASVIATGAAAVAAGLYFGMTQVPGVDEIHYRWLRWVFSPWVIAYFSPLGPWYAVVVGAAVRHSRSRPGWLRLAPVLVWAVPWCFWADFAARFGAWLHVGLYQIGIHIESVDKSGLAAAHDVHVAMAVVISGCVTAALTWWATGSRLVLVALLAVAPVGATLFRLPDSGYGALATWWVVAVVSLVVWARTRRLQTNDGFCPRCHYDLRGLPHNPNTPVTCPECGAAAPPSAGTMPRCDGRGSATPSAPP